MLGLTSWLVMLSCAGFALNWDVESVTEGGACSIAVDSVCLPRIAFAAAGRLGYASRNETSWDLTYPDTGLSSGISRVELCLDNNNAPHVGYVVAGWPEPSKLCHAFYNGNWHIDTVVAGAAPGSLTLYSLALAKDGTPHVLFVDSAVVVYAHKVGETWRYLVVPASQPDTLRLLQGASLDLDTNDNPGITVARWKGGSPDSLWLSFFEYDGQDWQRYDVDSIEGWAPWDFWPVRVRYDPASDLFHVVYRAWRYATGMGGNWQVGWTDGLAGNVLCNFALYQGRPHIASASPRDPVTYQWRSAGGWGTETVQYTSAGSDPSIAIDLTGRPHIAFQWGDTVFYARRLFIGAEEPPASVQPGTGFLVYPNPVTRTFTVAYTVPRGTTASITLTDAAGRTVWSSRDDVVPDKHRHNVNLPASISPGVYFCTLNVGAERVTRKVVLTD